MHCERLLGHCTKLKPQQTERTQAPYSDIETLYNYSRYRYKRKKYNRDLLLIHELYLCRFKICIESIASDIVKHWNMLSTVARKTLNRGIQHLSPPEWKISRFKPKRTALLSEPTRGNIWLSPFKLFYPSKRTTAMSFKSLPWGIRKGGILLESVRQSSHLINYHFLNVWWYTGRLYIPGSIYRPRGIKLRPYIKPI